MPVKCLDSYSFLSQIKVNLCFGVTSLLPSPSSLREVYEKATTTPQISDWLNEGKGIVLHVWHSLWCNVLTQAVFSRQPLFRLTFLKVVYLGASLCDLKMIRVFTDKIK